MKRQKKIFESDDMKYINYISWPAISHSGDRIAYVKSIGDEESGLFPSKIYLYDQQRQESIALNEDDYGFEKQPLFLKDEKHIAYLANKTGEFQIYTKNMDTGENVQITTLRHGVDRYHVSDDNLKFVVEGILWPEEMESNIEFQEMTAQQKEEWENELEDRPYYITDLIYKLDDWFGMRKGEYSHIGVVYLDGSSKYIMDTSGMEAQYPVWSHDGSKIAFYGYPYDGAKGRQAELFICDSDGNNRIQMTKEIGIYADHFPIFTSDDQSIISIGYPPFEDGSCIMLPYKIDLSSKQTTMLIDEWDDTICHGVQPMVASRSEYGDTTSRFMVSKDGDYLFFQSVYHGKGRIYKVNMTNHSKVEVAFEDAGDISEFVISNTGDILYSMGTWERPAELYFNGKKLTDSNQWLEDYQLGKVEECWTKSKDGKVDLLYYIVHPALEEPGKSYPAVLDIKGGPETVFTLSFWHEFQAISGKNIAAIYGNPRGSVGFGRKFCADAICWRNEAMEDMLAIVDDAIDKGFIERSKVGVTGGSYGGYLTNKLIGRTDYFAAAVTQRSLANPVTSYGTGDMGFVSSSEVPKNFKMMDYLEDRARGNIISYIDHFKIPLLILHAYLDYRCSYEQAEQLFIAMKDRNPEVPVKLVMFPKENHALTRTGKLYNQIRHLTELVDWFDLYLNKGGASNE